jgi:hypothetical protein
LVTYIGKVQKEVISLKQLSQTITEIVKLLNRKLVILIDEVDKSSNNQLFLHFLGLLRDKYLDRDVIPTFHAVVLAGVHDVKNLKLKLRPGEESKLNSPWNIATEFKVDMNLQPFEIIPMLKEYAADKNVQLDASKMADLLFYHTSGYPFLVSKLCKIIDEEILPLKSENTWTEEDIENAVHQLVGETNTNFETLTKNLENIPELYQLVETLLIAGLSYPYSIHDPIVQLGILHGIFVNKQGLAIHNRIYREIMYNYITFRALRTQLHVNSAYAGNYILPDNRLDIERLLLSFQTLMRDEYSKKDRDFIERQGRLIFLAFLKPILNGNGHTFKEPQISEEKRLDIVITYHQHKYIVELKIWRGEKAHKNGFQQLGDYLDRQGVSNGNLVIFDHSEVKEWKTKTIRSKGKRINVIWV